jgi:hypothetical protein
VSQPGEIQTVAFVGDYVPRKCGIATFTADLLTAVANEQSQSQCFAVPVNDTSEGYDYPPVVRFEIEEQDLASYQRAADFLNISNVDIVCLQHEFGIFGGPAGQHVLALVRELKILPPVTEFSSPRAWAFALLGIHEYLRRLSGDRQAAQAREALTARLMELFDRFAENEWLWFEEALAYDNARLAHALIQSGQATGRRPCWTGDWKSCAGWRKSKPPSTAISVRSAATGFIDVAGPALTSTSNRSKPIPWWRPAWTHFEPPRIFRGTNMPGALSTGSRVGTILAWNYTPRTRAVVVTRCAWIGSMKTAERNRRWHFCWPWQK